ncbi:hypothetical protein Tc00.1047053511089.15 [Trypanosoma cruzi]|uniref:Uncharacterized protein n=1 Tax=Trypanosoma cruzi (strain CL Brener) TaxID=353153 RepID=Q4DLB7_TRYCC|nr:hypothetical protein Tc00.1047053511089.15 [Trypanosoma cruzi]EAN93320.1 hypothetical protein Tc00.1047053511089.15 [Trypanosoma cruzi]|eukprot:XP_815171.1 hypothetical protein [Trypanosoma cruzi strain CL Brener]
MLGLAGGHTRKAVVSRQLVPRATGARTERCGAPRGSRRRHAHCNALLQSLAQRDNKECVDVCLEHSDRHLQRSPSWHRPSRVSTHRATPATSKVKPKRGKKNDPKSRQHLHTWRTSCSRVIISARDAGQRSTVAKTFLQSAVRLSMCVCARGSEKKRSTGRRINMAGGTAGWQRYMRYGTNLNNRSRWQHTHIRKNKKNKRKEKHGGRVWLCVWSCGCLPALAAKKTKQKERNVCSAPQALVARPHVTAPSARRSSRPLLMRAAGEAHRAVVMSVSVGVRVEQLGGKHTAPLAGRVQQQTIKEGRVEKKNTSIVIAPKSKKKRWGSEIKEQ